MRGLQGSKNESYPATRELQGPRCSIKAQELICPEIQATVVVMLSDDSSEGLGEAARHIIIDFRKRFHTG
jgi:hypothetical protein